MAKKDLNIQIKKEIENLYPVLKAFREDLHQHPELSWKEFRTTRKIEELLSENGLTDFQKPLETGGYIDFVNRDGSPFLLLRADIDALPIQDKKKKPYASRNEGICHSCGHDMHGTIIVGLMLLMKRLKHKLAFNLRFVFQPAEEVIPNGAQKMIDAGILRNVKYALGIHVEPRLEFGMVSLTPGWVNMQSVFVEMELSGSGGHSAYPHKSPDLVWIASRIIQESYQIIYREFDILKSPTILTFTEIEAGQGYNIMPSKLRFAGTLRMADTVARNQFYKRLADLTKFIEKETGAKIKIKTSEGAPPVLNNPELIQKLQDNSAGLIDSDKIATDFKTPGGDDFGSYSKEVPSALIRFGFAKAGFTSLLHTDTFDVPPELIKLAITFLSKQIIQFDMDV